jgi:hypothetical protein
VVRLWHVVIGAHFEAEDVINDLAASTPKALFSAPVLIFPLFQIFTSNLWAYDFPYAAFP